MATPADPSTGVFRNPFLNLNSVRKCLTYLKIPGADDPGVQDLLLASRQSHAGIPWDALSVFADHLASCGEERVLPTLQTCQSILTGQFERWEEGRNPALHALFDVKRAAGIEFGCRILAFVFGDIGMRIFGETLAVVAHNRYGKDKFRDRIKTATWCAPDAPGGPLVLPDHPGNISPYDGVGMARFFCALAPPTGPVYYAPSPATHRHFDLLSSGPLVSHNRMESGVRRKHDAPPVYVLPLWDEDKQYWQTFRPGCKIDADFARRVHEFCRSLVPIVGEGIRIGQFFNGYPDMFAIFPPRSPVMVTANQHSHQWDYLTLRRTVRVGSMSCIPRDRNDPNWMPDTAYFYFPGRGSSQIRWENPVRFTAGHPGPFFDPKVLYPPPDPSDFPVGQD